MEVFFLFFLLSMGRGITAALSLSATMLLSATTFYKATVTPSHILRLDMHAAGLYQLWRELMIFLSL
jgi:hypothetical protein